MLIELFLLFFNENESINVGKIIYFKRRESICAINNLKKIHFFFEKVY